MTISLETQNDADVGRICRALATVERRRVVDYFRDAVGTTSESNSTPVGDEVDESVPTVEVPLADLARVLATTDVTSSNSEANYRGTLHHIHLPLLAETPGINYDPVSRTVEYSADCPLGLALDSSGRSEDADE